MKTFKALRAAVAVVAPAVKEDLSKVTKSGRRKLAAALQAAGKKLAPKE